MSKNRDKKKREQQKRLQRRHRRKGKPPLSDLLSPFAGMLPPDVKMVEGFPGLPKASVQLEAFVEPFAGQANTMGAYRVLLGLGIVAWNAAQQPPEKRVEYLTPLLKPFAEQPLEFALTGVQLVAELIRRKETDPRFAKDPRYLLNFNLTETPDGGHLQVLSSLPDGEKE